MTQKTLCEQHTDNIERYAILYLQTGEERYFELVQKSKRALENVINAQQAAVNRLQARINELEAQQPQQGKLF